MEYIEGHSQTSRTQMESCHKGILTPLEGPDNTKLDLVIQLHSGEAGSHVSRKTARIQECLDHQGAIKMSFFQMNCD